MSLKLTNSNDRALGFVRAMAHGDSGVGKTTSLGVLPEKSTLIVSCERGLLPLRNKAFRVIMVENWDDIRSLTYHLQKCEVAEDGSLIGSIGDYRIDGVRIIAWDSLSEIYRMCIQQIIEVDRKSLYKERTNDETDHPIKVYEDLLVMEDYGLLYKRMMGFVSAINHLPCHTIFTSLTAWREDKHTGIDRRVPALHKSLANDIPAVFDLVMHMEPVVDNDGKNTRMFRTENDGVHLCKDASGCLLAMEPADWNVIFGKILGKKEKSNANAK